MRTSAIAFSVLAAAALLPAQHPCSAPHRLATLDGFQNDHYLGAPGQGGGVPQVLPPGYNGPMLLCDVTADADLSVSRIDVKLHDDGHVNWQTTPGVPSGPGLIGQTSSVNVYSTPGTWEATGPTTTVGWTLVATGTMTIASRDEHSSVVFSPPFTIPAGSEGLLLELEPVRNAVANIPYEAPPYAVHPELALLSFSPGIALSASDQFLAISHEDIGRIAFVAGPGPAPKAIPLEFHYSVARDAASYAANGQGCYDRPQAFYEVFEAGEFDLANTAIAMTPNGESYDVAAAGSGIVAPTSAPLLDADGLPMGDDDRTGTLALGFTFPYPAARPTASC